MDVKSCMARNRAKGTALVDQGIIVKRQCLDVLGSFFEACTRTPESHLRVCAFPG